MPTLSPKTQAAHPNRSPTMWQPPYTVNRTDAGFNSISIRRTLSTHSLYGVPREGIDLGFGWMLSTPLLLPPLVVAGFGLGGCWLFRFLLGSLRKQGEHTLGLCIYFFAQSSLGRGSLFSLGLLPCLYSLSVE